MTIHGDGAQTRDFVFVEDVARANLLAMDADLDPAEVLNVGTGRAVSINELYDELASIAGGGPEPERTPTRTGDVLHSVADVARIREKLAWEPRVERREGLARTLDWYRARRG